MLGGNLPPIGAQAVLRGVSAFNRDARSVALDLDRINRAALSLERTNSNVAALGVGLRAVSTTGAVGGLLAIAGAITAIGAAAEKQFKSVEVFGEATGRQMNELTKSAVELSRNFTTSLSDVAQAERELVKAGLSVEQVVGGALTATVALARVAEGEITVADAAERMSQTLTAFKLPATEAARVADVIASATKQSTANFADLNVQLKQLTPIAASLGATFEDSAAALVVLNQAGLRGEVAGTALKNALIALLDPTDKANKVLRDYNISLFDTEGKFLGLRAFFVQLNEAFGDQAVAAGKVTEQQRQLALSTIFSTRQIQAALTAINQGVGAFDDALANMNASAIEMARNLQDNIIDNFTLLKNNAVAAAFAISSQFIPSLTNLSGAAVKAAQSMDLEPFERFGQRINEILTLQDQGTLDTLRGIIDVATEYAAILEVAATRVSELASTAAEAIDDFTTPFIVGSQATIGFTGELETASDVTGRVFAAIAHIVEAAMNAYNSLIVDVGIGSLQALLRAEGIMLLETARIWGGFVDVIAQALRQAAINILKFAKSISPVFAAIPDNILRNLIPGVDGLLNAAAQIETSYAGAAITVNANVRAINDSIQGLSASAEQTTKRSNAAVDAFREGLKDFLADVRQVADGNKKAADDIIADYMRIVKGARDVEDAHDRLRRAQLNNARRTAVTGESPERGFLPSDDDDGGKQSKTEELRELTKLVESLLSDIPGMTRDLAEFIAKIGQDAPERLIPMVAAIRAAKTEVSQLVLAKRDVLATSIQLQQVESRLADLQLEQSRVSIAQAQAVIKYDMQLLGLRHDLLSIDRQTWPIRDALLKIERQIEVLQRENLALARERLSLELEMLPIQNEISDIEKQLNKLNQEDLNLTARRIVLERELRPLQDKEEALQERLNTLRQRNFTLDEQVLRNQLAALPVRREIEKIEERINNLVDKRQSLLDRRARLNAEGGIAGTRAKLQEVQDQLDDLNSGRLTADKIPMIVALEEQKKLLEEELETGERALKTLTDQQDSVARATELATIELELEKLAVEDQLKPYEDKLLLFSQQAEQQELLNELLRLGIERELAGLADTTKGVEKKLAELQREIDFQRERDELVRLSLEAEKRALEAQLEPLQLKLEAIQREIAEENLRNQITITHLEEERRRLQDQLIPLEDVRRAIERQIAEIDFLRDAEALEFEKRKLQIQELILAEQARQLELEATLKAQQAIFNDLVLQFLESITKSKAFTSDEALEVAKRLKLWDEQVAKIAESVTEMSRLEGAAEAARQALDAIPKDITITITTVHKSVGGPAATTTSSEGEPASEGSAGFQSLSNVTSGEVAGTTVVNNTTNNFNLSPRYENIQSPASLRHDMVGLILRAQRG